MNPLHRAWVHARDEASAGMLTGCVPSVKATEERLARERPKTERPRFRGAVGFGAWILELFPAYGIMVVASVEMASPFERTPTAMMTSAAATAVCVADVFQALTNEAFGSA